MPRLALLLLAQILAQIPDVAEIVEVPDDDELIDDSAIIASLDSEHTAPLEVFLIQIAATTLTVLVAMATLAWKAYGAEIAKFYIADPNELNGEGRDFLSNMPVHSFEQRAKKPTKWN